VDAAQGYKKHLDSGGKMFVSLAGAMSTAELGKSLAEMIRQGKVHAICCTGANLEEDLFNLVAHTHYKRIPNYRDLTPQDERALLDGLVDRAEPILSRPMRERLAGVRTETRILNVDDNDAMLFVKSRYLREEGYDVLEARTGARALELIQTRPNLVLLDVHLPDANGVDICRQIKSNPELDTIKVIQMSATFTSPHDQLQGLQSGGADLYLTEPVTRGTLLSVVRRLLAS
jgi:CheY-like chemotaxis protein